jgi:hypothetical protein
MCGCCVQIKNDARRAWHLQVVLRLRQALLQRSLVRLRGLRQLPLQLLDAALQLDALEEADLRREYCMSS